MAGDYSRKTFNRKKHYSGVLMQQGRVQLDADWNEQLDIRLYRTETEATDVIGLCGVPKSGDGFKINTDGKELFIAPGRIYAGGLLCELEADKQATYTNQPYYPNPEFTSALASPVASPLTSPPAGSQLRLDDGTYMVYIDAWQREITALDDPSIREKALGGPDTATRMQTVWQVRLLRVTAQADVTCDTQFPEYQQRTAASTGRLTAQTKQADDPKDPCLLPPKAGYLRLENQLYRVEVHRGGDRSVATFKWSRDNASVETSVEPGKVNGSQLTVSEIAKDEVLGFHLDDWVELVTEEAALNREPFPLARIQQVNPATRKVTLSTSVPARANVSSLKLRRWDQTGAVATADGVPMAAANLIDLEEGIQVSFSNGSYQAGDYWLIPARTATGQIEWPPFEIPNTNPLSQLPIGVKHHHCQLALVEVQGGVIRVKEDCRKRFPPLTEICAEDVCFDNDNCKMPGVETVQDALDRLCAARDLRFHNKHLHGWGIVCGLQVECGPDAAGSPRRHVTVRKGYALDCEGNDIILDRDEGLDLAALSAGLASPLSSPPGLTDGELALYIELDEKQRPRFRVEPYKPKSAFESMLQGTLLMDFINECIQKLSDFFREEFTARSDEVNQPVGPARKRLTTLLNLLIQIFNPTNGSFVFLSREEDKILRGFYERLRALLQSHTFCAMFDGARQFPEKYPFPDPDIVTIFGKGSHQRLRIAPNSKVGYAVGGGNKIAVFDLAKNQMAAELEFPGGSNSMVQDVAFSKDGRLLFAVATLNNKDSSFAVADVSGLNHLWRKPTVICDVQLITLATVPAVSNDVYAIARGKGLYQINPDNINATPTPMGNFSFNASGHMLVFEQEAIAYATASGASAVGKTYDRVVRVNLRSPTNNPPPILLSNPAGGPLATGQDDIAFNFSGTQVVRLYVVINPTPGLIHKQVMIFDAIKGQLLFQRSLGEADTDIRLAFNPATNRMVVGFEESYRLAVLNVDDVPEPSFRFPVQISPISVAVAPNQKRFFALNFASNTVSSLSSDLLDPKRQLSMKDLVDYRTAVLNAFFDLFGGLLQYLKDCLCDHFLVNCPTCDADDKIYLAVVSVKNRQVYKVCNFSLRKYVKSFPTLEYWLSLVPVLPLFKTAVERFCCAALPGFFGRQNAPAAQVSDEQITLADNRVKSRNIRSSVEFVKTTDFRSATRLSRSKIGSSSSLIFDALTTGTRRQEITRPQVEHREIAGQPVDEAKRKLEGAKVNVVGVENYDPNAGLSNVFEFSRAPLRLEEGAEVKLIVKDDKVLFYSKVEKDSPQISILRKEITETKTAVDEFKTTAGEFKTAAAEVKTTAAQLKTAAAEAAQLRAELNTLKRQMTEAEERHKDEITSRDKDIQKNSEALKELKEQVGKLGQKKVIRTRRKVEKPQE